MIKLIAIDLDGTLFNPDQQITPHAQAAIQQAHAAGVRTMIVTGRGRRGAEHALDLLGLDLPYICSAGALLRPGKQGKAIAARTFHHMDELSNVIAFTRANNAGLIAETPTQDYWFGPDSLGEQLDPLTASSASTTQRSFAPEQDFDQPLLKVTFIGEPELLDKVHTLAHERCPSLRPVYSGMRYVDLTRRGVDKGSALALMTDYLDLRPDEIAAIGDQPIDVPMLEYAGLGIAMGNASPTVQQAAQWVAPGNDQDGVAWALERILDERA